MRSPSLLVGREFSATIFGGFEIRAIGDRIKIETPSANFLVAQQIIECDGPDPKLAALFCSKPKQEVSI